MTTLELIGQVIDDKYRVLSEIGQGGWGVIVLVERIDEPSGGSNQFALKILHLDVLFDDESRQRFAREALSLTMLKHPNIVHLFEFGEWDCCPYYVMELLNGRTLKKVLKDRKTLSIRETADIGLQLCSAMSQVHAGGIIHRDITPANLHVDERDAMKLKLLDFGLATFVGLPKGNRLTRTGTTLGSCLYMSPEQARGEQSDARTDIYSIGCVLYECLTGQPPFPADTGVAAMMQHIHNPIPDLPGATADGAEDIQLLNSILRQALAKEKEDRFQKAGDMLDALRPLGSLTDIRRYDNHTAQIRINHSLVHAAKMTAQSAEDVGDDEENDNESAESVSATAAGDAPHVVATDDVQSVGSQESFGAANGCQDGAAAAFPTERSPAAIWLAIGLVLALAAVFAVIKLSGATF